MPKPCVKLWDNLRTIGCITRGELSTKCIHPTRQYHALCAQAQVFRVVLPRFHPELFTLKDASLPLIEHKFYPLSTEPIISITNLKKKEYI